MENTLNPNPFRKQLESAVLFRIEQEVDQVIASLRNPTAEIAAAIQEEILPQSRFRLSRPA